LIKKFFELIKIKEVRQALNMQVQMNIFYKLLLLAGAVRNANNSDARIIKINAD